MALAVQALKKDAHERDIFFFNKDIWKGPKNKENGQQSMDAPTHLVIPPSTIYWAPTTHKTLSGETSIFSKKNHHHSENKIVSKHIFPTILHQKRQFYQLSIFL